jgi:hypothetical protein
MKALLCGYAPTMPPPDNPGGGSHRQFGQGRLAFAGESTDGVTNPMTFTAK